MKRIILYTALLLAIAFSTSLASGPAQAQQEDLDTILARATAKSFLTALLRPDLSGVMTFYLLDSVDANEIKTALQDDPATDFEITGSQWVSDVTYQLKANLIPGNCPIAVYTGKYDGRWRVEGIDLALASEAASTGPAETAAPTAGPAIAPASNNGPGQLVFQSQSGGDIYIIKADGTGLRRITHGIDPQLSPDGTKIAFTRWEPRYELFTINVDGSGEQAWTSSWRKMKSPTWSADGSKLTFSWQNGGRLEADERKINLEKHFRDNDGEPPNISSKAIGIEVENGILKYTIPADAHWHLKQIDLQTGQLLDLGTERHSYGSSGHPTEATQVIYRGDHGLAVYNCDTGLDQLVTPDNQNHTPLISPDGSRITSSYWQNDHWEIHTLNIDGTGQQRLTSTPLSVLAENRPLTSEFVAGKERFVASQNPSWNNAAPTWSPDGSQIAFVTDRTSRWEIWIMNADGSGQRPMFSNGELDDISLNYAGVDERMLSWR